METRIEPRSAGIKPVTLKPSMKDAANQNIKALMTKVNRPRVMMLIGSVRSRMMGRTIKLRRPRIIAAMMAI